jgi:hypothetical protein
MKLNSAMALGLLGERAFLLSNSSKTAETGHRYARTHIPQQLSSQPKQPSASTKIVIFAQALTITSQTFRDPLTRISPYTLVMFGSARASAQGAADQKTSHRSVHLDIYHDEYRTLAPPL